LDEAGYCQVIHVKNEITESEVIIALLGSNTVDDRWQELKGLVDWVFRHYSWQ